MMASNDERMALVHRFSWKDRQWKRSTKPWSIFDLVVLFSNVAWLGVEIRAHEWAWSIFFLAFSIYFVIIILKTWAWTEDEEDTNQDKTDQLRKTWKDKF